MTHVQKQDVQLPPGQWIDTWTLTRNIAKAFHPSLRNATGISCVVAKRLTVKVETDSVDLDLPYAVSTENLDELRPLLKDLPQLREGMTEAELIVFMAAYEVHPARLPWKPIIATYEDVRRADNLVDLFQHAHRVEMQTEVDQGKLVIVDRRHLLKSEIGMDVYIARDAALAYLQRRGMRYETGASRPAVSGAHPGLKSQSISETTPGSMLDSSTAPTLQIAAPTETSPKEDVTSGAPQEVEAFPHLATRSLPAPDQPDSFAENESRRTEVSHDIGEITKGLKAKLASIASSQSTKLKLPSQPNDAPPGSERDLVRKQPRIILRLPQVEERTGLSGSAIYDKLKTTSPRFDSTFPKQLKIGTERVGWIESEVDTWIESKMSNRSSD